MLNKYQFVASIVLACALSLRAQDLPRRNIFGAAVNPDRGGVLITALVPDSPAELAALKVGDVITRLGTTTISNVGQFLQAVRAATPSTPMSVAVFRAGNPEIFSVHIVPAPKEADPDVETIYSAVQVGASLRRTLVTLPKGTTRNLPAVLVIGGIGCYSVDNPFDLNDPYRALAHDLGRSGFVVMRVEKSGIGDSQGEPCFETGFTEESEMYAAALTALLRTPHVDPRRVFLFGHSIGTLIAPRLAIVNPVAGVIVAEAVGINWFEYELANLRRQSVLDGDSPSDTDNLLRSKENCMHRLLIDREPDASIERKMPECKSRNSYPVAAPYMQEVAALNVAEPWTRITVPVLVLYGTADFVTAETEHKRIVDIVNAEHAGSASFQVVQGMDHHLELMGTATDAYDRRVKRHEDGRYAKQLSIDVAEWLCIQISCGPS
ncbi:MAG: alpha/beta fold hydrolase [Acidobacteriaceae bacterium]|nr:alpha/beta fold hydrolase [Acidobacteriaceae bacterium]